MRALVLISALACAGAAPPLEAPAGATESPVDDSSCTARVAPGAPIQPHLVDGAVVCLAPGVHPGGLRVTASVDIIGEPGAVLDGGGRAPVVHVAANGIELRLQGLELRNGYAEFGAGLRVDAYAQVAIENCVVRDNIAGQGKGVGIGMARGRLLAKGLRTGPGSDLFFDVVAEGALEDAVLDGGLHVRDGAKVALRGGSVAAPLTVAGTTTRRPQLVLEGVTAPAVDNHAQLPGTVERR